MVQETLEIGPTASVNSGNGVTPPATTDLLGGMQQPYRIDPFFANLLPKLPAENRRELKLLIEQHGGCFKPLIVWGEPNILLDGHHRVELIAELRAEGVVIRDPGVIRMSFAARWQAAFWVLQNQTAQRPNWSKLAMAQTLLQNKELVAEIERAASERMLKGEATNGPKGRTIDILAKLIGVGRTTVYYAQKEMRDEQMSAEETDNVERSATMLDQLQKVSNEKGLSAKLIRGDVTPKQAMSVIKAKERREQHNVEAARAAKDIPTYETTDGSVLNSIVLTDATDGLKATPTGSVSLVLTSPPYPVKMVRYPRWVFDGDYAKYLEWTELWMAEAARVLVDGGRMAVNYNNCYPTKEDRPNGDLRLNLHADLSMIARKLGLKYRDTVIWYKQNCDGIRPMVGSPERPSSPRFQTNFEYVSIWQKGKDSHSPQIEGAKTDLRSEDFWEWTVGHWYIKPANREKTEHRAAFPEELAHRLIQLLTYRSDTVLDPFNGSGTTTAVAARLGRQFIGFDNAEQYVQFARQRTQVAIEEARQVATNPIDESAIRSQTKMPRRRQIVPRAVLDYERPSDAA